MQRGFTLIELMITLAILAILVSATAPSFTRMIEDNRVTTQANTLLSSFSLARFEAIKRGVNVTVTPKSGGYGNGWCVHTGAVCTDGTIRDNEALAHVAATGGNSDSDLISAITYDSFGVNAAAATRTINLAPPNCKSGDLRLRRLTVSPGGHAAITVVGCP